MSEQGPSRDDTTTDEIDAQSADETPSEAGGDTGGGNSGDNDAEAEVSGNEASTSEPVKSAGAEVASDEPAGSGESPPEQTEEADEAAAAEMLTDSGSAGDPPPPDPGSEAMTEDAGGAKPRRSRLKRVGLIAGSVVALAILVAGVALTIASIRNGRDHHHHHEVHTEGRLIPSYIDPSIDPRQMEQLAREHGMGDYDSHDGYDRERKSESRRHKHEHHGHKHHKQSDRGTGHGDNHDEWRDKENWLKERWNKDGWSAEGDWGGWHDWAEEHGWGPDGSDRGRNFGDFLRRFHEGRQASPFGGGDRSEFDMRPPFFGSEARNFEELMPHFGMSDMSEFRRLLPQLFAPLRNNSGNPGMPFGMWQFGEDDRDYLMENGGYCVHDEDGASYCTYPGPGMDFRDMMEMFENSDGMWFHDMFDDPDDMYEDMDEMDSADDLDGLFEDLEGFSSSGEFCFGDSPVVCVDPEMFSGLLDDEALGEMLFGLMFGLGDGESGLNDLFEMFGQLLPEVSDELLEEESDDTPEATEEEEVEEAEEEQLEGAEA